jgi:WD40 repeat protein
VASPCSGIALAALLAAACGGGEDLTEPLTGSVRTTIATTGTTSGPPAYALSIDGGAAQAVGDSAVQVQSGLEPGIHTIQLLGVSPECAVEGANPRQAEVTAGHTATVAFRVGCSMPPADGILEVSVTTAGSDLDPDGYTVIADPDLSAPAALNDTVVFPSVDAGTHAVRVSGLAGNCTLPTNPDTVTVAAGDTARVAFQVTCWPPLTGTIRFSRADSLFSIGADGRNLVQLTTPPPPPDEFTRGDEWPALSPDGQRLAFVRQDRIFVGDRNGQNAVQLTPDTLFPDQSLPRWSPDGRTILFLLGFPGNDDGSPLYTINADGTGLRRVASSVVWFSWAPDGRRIAAVLALGIFCCSPESHLFLMNPDGTGSREITEQGRTIFSISVEWSPDGNRLALAAFGISLIDTLGTVRETIFSPDESSINSAAWSPDGTRLVFSMGGLFGNGPARLYVINRDGSGFFQLTDPPQPEFGDSTNKDESPVWSP